MKITVFGASGSVGIEVVRKALQAGYQVRAVARKPEVIEFSDDNLELYSANVLDPQAVRDAVAGSSGVIICLGSKKLTGKLRSEGTHNIIEAMQKTGVKRLICQTSLGVGDSHANLNWFWKYLMFGILLRFVMRDHHVQEELVRKSSLDWTIVRPAAFVDESQGLFKQGFEPTEKDLSLTIARTDLGAFLVEQVESFLYLRKTPGLSY